ncbi:hypothetical protein COB64_01890 [Candidatus Wolfebacteria bacterium]|nr:MAG: hypothetical protein COB64_01890 [Candidatus Wolfebacteria bacterium]
MKKITLVLIAILFLPGLSHSNDYSITDTSYSTCIDTTFSFEIKYLELSNRYIVAKLKYDLTQFDIDKMSQFLEDPWIENAKIYFHEVIEDLSNEKLKLETFSNSLLSLNCIKKAEYLYTKYQDLILVYNNETKKLENKLGKLEEL